MFGVYKYLVIGVVVAMVVGFAYWQYERANQLQRDNATLHANVETLTGAVEEQRQGYLNLEAHVLEQRERLEDLDLELFDVRRETMEQLSNLNQHRSTIRERALADPTDIGRRATRATVRVYDRLMCATDLRNRDEDGCYQKRPTVPVEKPKE